MNNSTCLSTTSPGNSAWSFGTRYKKRQQLSYRSMWSSSESWEFFWGKVEGCGGLQESRHLQVCFFHSQTYVDNIGLAMSLDLRHEFSNWRTLDYKLNSSQDFSNIYRFFNLNTMETNICQDWSLVFVDESGGAFRLKSCWKADRLDSLCLYFQYHGSV